MRCSRHLILLLALVACSDTGRPGPRSTATPGQGAVAPPVAHWYFMGDAAVPLPATCSAKCVLECDVWSGQIDCGDTHWSTYGGFSTMVGMQLEQRGASVEGRETLADGATLRWGTGPKQQFCVTIDRTRWLWEICGPDRPADRVAMLDIARGHRVNAPADDCEHGGC